MTSDGGVLVDGDKKIGAGHDACLICQSCADPRSEDRPICDQHRPGVETDTVYDLQRDLSRTSQPR